MNGAAQLTLSLPHPLAARQALFMSADGQPFATSRAVAERFGRRHKDVLKAIKNLLAELPDPEFLRRNFAARDYVDVRGKTQPEYRLSHDGFALLAMGLTGADARAWKVAFLQAFNAMELELQRLQHAKSHALDVLRPSLQPVLDGELHDAESHPMTTKTQPTPNQIKHKLRQEGLTLKKFAEANGFKYRTVCDAVCGQRLGNYGEGRDVRIKLGLPVND